LNALCDLDDLWWVLKLLEASICIPSFKLIGGREGRKSGCRDHDLPSSPKSVRKCSYHLGKFLFGFQKFILMFFSVELVWGEGERDFWRLSRVSRVRFSLSLSLSLLSLSLFLLSFGGFFLSPFSLSLSPLSPSLSLLSEPLCSSKKKKYGLGGKRLSFWREISTTPRICM